MEQINISTFMKNVSYYTKKAQDWAIFVYPTDTIYWVWGIVVPDVIQKIDTIKQRKPGKYYSIIAPSFGWISANFEVQEDFKSYREQQYKSLGPLTHLLLLKDSDELIWVRYLDHPFQQFVTQLWEPFITTSVNISGEPNITSLREISPNQKNNIDIAIDVGEIVWSWSTIINYLTWERIR